MNIFELSAKLSGEKHRFDMIPSVSKLIYVPCPGSTKPTHGMVPLGPGPNLVESPANTIGFSACEDQSHPPTTTTGPQGGVHTYLYSCSGQGAWGPS